MEEATAVTSSTDYPSEDSPLGKCSQCSRAKKVCVCALVPAEPFMTDTRIVILIHPKETRRASGTVPLLQLCLKNLKVVCGASFGATLEDAAEELRTELCGEGTEFRRPTFLVMPGPTAEVLRRKPKPTCEEDSERYEVLAAPAAGQTSVLPTAMQRTLIFVDGTWRQAKQMIRNTPWLTEMSRVCLDPDEESRYRFRKQPQKVCLSTLEAVADCLVSLEHDVSRAWEVHAVMTRLFAGMVSHQLAYIPKFQREGGSEGASANAAADPSQGEGSRSEKAAARAALLRTWCLVRRNR
eukprot:CAMPEP_0170636224 /NCGR_PEP_ID=MMETSP0224-20130122/37667_1 /TAXON_ID=285029 /ORGANISM="Togula jolla, Strain CCCM 725" /LENGTH=295 /DNA_ID=CAMNT_0010965829 /DNA_START=48 /DNA_END=931 /DNA_ORIENTATION=+